MRPEVSIVTVIMNHLSVLKDMLESLFITTKPSVSFELIIVDNCSTDGSANYIKEHYPSVVLIENKKEQGFAKNNNDGAKVADGNYILILNPDITLINNAIDVLYDYIKTNPSVGIVAPKLLNPDLSLQYSARKFISLKVLFIRIFTKGKDDIHNKAVQHYLMYDSVCDGPIEVDWCMGAALLFKKDFYFELGGFDEKFFLYVEDADICNRCWKAGKKVIYLPQAEVIHMHQRSSKNFNKKTWIHLQSFFYFFKKNHFKIKRDQ